MGVDFLKVFDRLLPRSRAWSLVYDRTLRRFFEGIATLPETIKDHVDSVFLEAFPQETTNFFDWSLQFGSPEDLDAEGLEGEWAAFGAQDPQYFQDIIQAAGFENLYVHEWPVPASDPVESRNPIPLVPSSRVLVNDIVSVEKAYRWQSGGSDGEQSRSDNSIRFGDYTGWELRSKVYPCRDIPAEYVHYFYLCGPIWPQYGIVLKSELRKLMRLIYKLKPMHLRCVLRVQVVDDGDGDGDWDIQDTWWHDDQYQDTIDGDDIIEEYY